MACCCNSNNSRATACNACRTKAVCGCPPNSDCCGFPVEDVAASAREMRLCCDQDGCCGMFPQDCRNTFWPDFAHPRWLCCRDLYCSRKQTPACC